MLEFMLDRAILLRRIRREKLVVNSAGGEHSLELVINKLSTVIKLKLFNSLRELIFNKSLEVNKLLKHL